MEEPESAQELTWRVKVEVGDLDITRIVRAMGLERMK